MRRSGGHSGLCHLCGGPHKKRGAARRADAVADCGLCRRPVCQRHLRWDTEGGRNVCTRCVRDFNLSVTGG